jgi:hypothetical protein
MIYGSFYDKRGTLICLGSIAQFLLFNQLGDVGTQVWIPDISFLQALQLVWVLATPGIVVLLCSANKIKFASGLEALKSCLYNLTIMIQ